MAIVREMGNGSAGPAMPPPSLERKKGKPRRPRTKPDAEDLAGIPTSTEIDDDKETPFFEQLQMYPAEEWGEKLFMYLFRTAPVIDRGRTGSDHNIQKFAQPIDPDTIMRASYGGSGGYKLILNRWDPGTRKTQRIRDHYFTILNMDFPPRIPAGEWLDSDKNREWAWARPKLEALALAEETAAKQANPNTPAAAMPAAMDPTGVFGVVMKVVEKFLPQSNRDQATELAGEVIKTMREHHKEAMADAKANPEQFIGLVGQIAGLLRPAGGDSVVTELLRGMREELAEERRFNRELLGKLQQSNPAPTLRAQLEDMVSLKELAGSLFGRSAPRDAKTDWPDTLARIGEKLVEEAPAFIQAYALGQSGIRRSVTVSRTQPAPAGGNGAPAGIQEPEMEEREQMIQQLNAQFGQMFDEVTPDLVKHFSRGLTGMDFRDWFTEEYGRKTYDFMKSMDPQTIVDLIEFRKTQASPQLQTELALLRPPAKLKQFVLEFLSDAEAEDYEATTTAAAPSVQPVEVREREF